MEWTREEMEAAKGKLRKIHSDFTRYPAVVNLQCEVTALRETLRNLRATDLCGCLDDDDNCPHAVADRLLAHIPK